MLPACVYILHVPACLVLMLPMHGHLLLYEAL